MSERFFQSEEAALRSEIVDIARGVMPEGVKRMLRPILGKESRSYPLPEPVTVNVGGVDALFHIKTHNDWLRLKSKKYTEPYDSDIMSIIGAQDSPVVVDVGSAQGGYSIPAALIGAEVYSIDPDPLSIESIKENLLLNPETEGKVTLIPLALSNERGNAEFYIDNRGEYAPSLVKTVRGLRDVVNVQMVPFDDLVNEGKVGKPTVMKIDVEGAEGQVIGGMSRTLSGDDCPTDIFLELHKQFSPKFGYSPMEVRSMVEDHGYQLDSYWPRGGELHCHFKK